MRSWISLHHPLLALEAFQPRWCDPGTQVVIDHDRVWAMSETAAYNGVRLGMRHGGVAMLCPDATVFYRDGNREEAALQAIALAMMQYTPEVAVYPESSLVMDVSASLKLFHGTRRLCQAVRGTIQALGFTVQLGMAPTASGAWLLARRAPSSVASMHPAAVRRVLGMASLARRLDALPCSLLPQAQPYRDWLEGIGCATLGDLRRLPKAGLLRRSGQPLLDSLDRAYGHAPELHEWVKAPPEFSGGLELPAKVEHAEGLVFAARRLLLELTGWLTARQLAVSRIALLMEHERGRLAVEPTSIEIILAEPAWQEDHLLVLLKERLERTTLKAPVIALRLQARHLAPMLPPTDALFPEPGGTPADFSRLLEKLTARLGEQAVLVPDAVEDHRPEACNRWTPAGQGRQGNQMHSARAMRQGASDEACGVGAVAGAAFMPPHAERPFWMLSVPLPLMMHDFRPFYGSALKLVGGPERIEAGWWDGGLAVRDYFIAQGEEGALYWLFRERAGEDWRWFLHGLFA